MSFGGKRVDSAGASPLKKFVSESQIETQRREKESAWQSVRTAAGGGASSSAATTAETSGDSAPSYDPNDTRTLYERLNSQKQNKQLAFDEAHKLKNQLSVIDTEEAEFLEQVDRVRERELLERQREQDEILKELRQSALAETEKSLEVKRAVLLGTPAQSSTTAFPAKSIASSNKLASLRLAVKRKMPVPEQQPVTHAEKSLPVVDAAMVSVDAGQPGASNNSAPEAEVYNNTSGVARVIATLPSLVPAYTGVINVNKHASHDDDENDAAGDDSDSSDSSDSDKKVPVVGFSLLSGRRKADLAIIKRRKKMRKSGGGIDAGDESCNYDGSEGSDDE